MASARTWKGILWIIGGILKAILISVTPMIKEALQEGMVKLLEKARDTENPIDDLFVELLFKILDIDIPPEA